MLGAMSAPHPKCCACVEVHIKGGRVINVHNEYPGKKDFKSEEMLQRTPGAAFVCDSLLAPFTGEQDEILLEN